MPYKYGAKWDLKAKNPVGPVDCSGFVRWVYFQNGILIPDGSANQYAATKPTDNPQRGDLGFFKHEDSGRIYHVGILYSPEWVIEARGEPYNMVLTRPRAKWEAYHRFTGWRTLDPNEKMT